MPKANKHAEVKPSKYKTSLCQYFLRGEDCPFGERCAFAHGEADLKTEEKNVALLKATGLQRLDKGPSDAPASTAPSAVSSPGSVSGGESNNASFTPSSCDVSAVSTSQPTSSVRARQRRPIMISLPVHGAACGANTDAYATQLDAYRYAQFSYRSAPVLAQATPQPPAAQPPRTRCQCDFSSTCRREPPVTYRHNPYRLGARVEYV